MAGAARTAVLAAGRASDVEVLIRRSCALHDRRAGCVAYNPSMQSSAAVASGGDATGSSLPLPLHGCLPPIRITRALTLRQPWAWAVAAGHKDVENRTWQTPHRGWLAIHAGGEWADSGAVALCTQLLDDAGVAIPPKQHLIRSAIIAVVFVEDCIAPDTPLQSPGRSPTTSTGCSGARCCSPRRCRVQAAVRCGSSARSSLMRWRRSSLMDSLLRIDFHL